MDKLSPEEFEALKCLYNGWWIKKDMIPVLIEKNLAWYRPLDKITKILTISTTGLRLIEEKKRPS